MGAAPRALLAAVAAAHGVHARNADPKAGYCYAAFGAQWQGDRSELVPDFLTCAEEGWALALRIRGAGEYACEGGNIQEACSDPMSTATAVPVDEAMAAPADYVGFTCFVADVAFTEYPPCGVYSYSYDYCDPLIEPFFYCACEEYGECGDSSYSYDDSSYSYDDGRRRLAPAFDARRLAPAYDARRLDEFTWLDGHPTCAGWELYPDHLANCASVLEGDYPACHGPILDYVECVHANLASEMFDLDCDIECPYAPSSSYSYSYGSYGGGGGCDIETSDDLSSSPSGTTNWGAGIGWCSSDLNKDVGCAASPGDCWELCFATYGDQVVAVEWDNGSEDGHRGKCWCQNDCRCMADADQDWNVLVYVVARDSLVALPQSCQAEWEAKTAACLACVNAECDGDEPHAEICSDCLGEDCDACRDAFGESELAAFVSGGCDLDVDDDDDWLGGWFRHEGCGSLRGCTSTSYVRGEAGSSTCPDGYVQITSEEECSSSEVGAAVGRTWTGSYCDPQSGPSGCAMNTGSLEMWFMDCDADVDASWHAPVCKRGPCCVEHAFHATGEVASTTCYGGRSPWEASTMSDLCTAGHSDTGAMAPPFRNCSQAAIDAGKCGTADWDTCAECADHDIPTGNFFANVGYTSCPDWVVDAAHEEAAEGGQCAPWFGYEDGDEDDDDCTPGYWAMECRDDGHLWRADTCASCEDCPPVYDLTAATEGRYTCEPGTNTYYYDEDLDGNTDGEAQFEACGYDDCSGDEDGDEDGVDDTDHWWHYYHEEEDDDDDGLGGGSELVMSGGLVAIGLTFTGITIATIANLVQEQCALGPTIVYEGHRETEAGTTGPYLIGPNLCTIGTHTYASKKIVRDTSPRKVCRKFCEAASSAGKLALKHVQGLTCYCKRR